MHRSVMSLLLRVTSFRGRVGRGDFWAVFLFAAVFLLQVIAPLILASFTSRRLHDLDKPGWWTVPFLAALLALAVIWTPTGQSALGLLAGGGGMLGPMSYVLTTFAAGIVTAFLCLL